MTPAIVRPEHGAATVTVDRDKTPKEVDEGNGLDLAYFNKPRPDYLPCKHKDLTIEHVASRCSESRGIPKPTDTRTDTAYRNRVFGIRYDMAISHQLILFVPYEFAKEEALTSRGI
jgi:hypothetical protein